MSTKPEVRAEAAAESVIEERLQALAEMVIFGASRREVTQFVLAQWGLSRRTAQEYLKRVQERLARDTVAQAAGEDRLFYLKLSQLQRDRLVGLALRYAHENREKLDPRVLQALAGIITAVRGLLDSRDRAAGEIHQLVTEHGRQADDLSLSPLRGESGARGNTGRFDPAPEPAADGDPPPSEVNGEVEEGEGSEPPPLPAVTVKRLGRRDSTKPKSNGRKGIEPHQEEPEPQYPDCADCAGAFERQEAALVAG